MSLLSSVTPVSDICACVSAWHLWIPDDIRTSDLRQARCHHIFFFTKSDPSRKGSLSASSSLLSLLLLL